MEGTTKPRVFLVVVDESEELQTALQYAARRAAHTGGRIALLYVIEPSELQHWVAIENLAREESREEAEQVLQRLCEEIAPIAGTMPIVYIREGRRRDELLALIAARRTALCPAASDRGLPRCRLCHRDEKRGQRLAPAETGDPGRDHGAFYFWPPGAARHGGRQRGGRSWIRGRGRSRLSDQGI